MNVGIIINNLGPNQQAFTTINRVNSLGQMDIPYKLTVFYKEPAQNCCRLATASTTFDRIFGFDGVLIATDLDLTLFMLRANMPKVKVLYMFDLDWVRGFGNYIQNYSMYNDPNLIVIAPSMAYANELTNYCGRKANGVVPQFNILDIMKVVENELRIRKSS
jgi:hypothetical protein